MFVFDVLYVLVDGVGVFVIDFGYWLGGDWGFGVFFVWDGGILDFVFVFLCFDDFFVCFDYVEGGVFLVVVVYLGVVYCLVGYD